MVKHKQEVMSLLREEMSEDNPDELYPPSLDPEKCRIDECLDAKFQEDGCTLLMHAAALGRKKWFLYFAERIRFRMGLSVLVKQLKGLDLEGAPLLFLAASSHTSETCFEAVQAKIKSVLDMVGVREQLTAMDHRQRGIMTYAAKSNHSKVFIKVCKMMKAQCKRTYHEEKEARMKLGHSPQDEESWINDKWSALFARRDVTGRTLLHHASEAGSTEVLEEVSKLAIDEGSFKEMSDPDENGRTPIMHVLRNLHGHDVEETKKKFDRLWERPYTRSTWMKERKIRSPKNLINDGRPDEERFTTGSTELLHAVRGGPCTFALALEKWREIKKVGSEENRLDYIDDILEVKMLVRNGDNEEQYKQRSPDPRTWGRALLLAAAARGGHVEVLKDVVSAIEAAGKKGTSGPGSTIIKEDDPVQSAIKEIQDSGRSLLILAILSGSIEAVKWVNKIVNEHFEKDTEKWDILSGQKSDMSSLTCAAMAPITAPGQGEKMFYGVLSLLAAASALANEEDSRKLLHALFIPRMTSKLSPLAGAALMNNWHLFREVYKACPLETDTKKKQWSRTDVPKTDLTKTKERHDMQEVHPHKESGYSPWSAGPSAIMWHDMVEAFRRAEYMESPDEGDLTHPDNWRDKFKEHSKRAVEQAAKRGNFDSLRDLVEVGFPLQDDDIPKLLELIGDFEQDIMEIIMATVGKAINPLVMAANVSKRLEAVQARYPMLSRSLRQLQEKIDALSHELLDTLPQTVRGIGQAALGRNRHIFLNHDEPVKKDPYYGRLRDLVGYIIVGWIIEPTFLSGGGTRSDSTGEVEYVDPLQRALDRGSEALNFVNSPLVLDYIHVKFSCTLPSWTSSNPFNYIINEGFYLYDTSIPVEKRESNGTAHTPSQREESILSGAFLLRIMQGWDKGSGMAPGTKLVEWILPHKTLLPGLQFILAGILGKPETFFEVPVIRFMFEILSYTVTVGLFCSCVMLRDAQVIPDNEATFYVFVLGMLWREILEFLDGVPHRTPVELDTEKRLRTFKRNRGPDNRGVTAIQRYVFYDTWNVLDALTIIFIMVAFVFRIVAKDDPWGIDGVIIGDRSFFIAQMLLATSGPLLFARALLLSQIDITLGPMTQILWRMVAHLARFSAFVILVMASFALAFNALYAHCADKEIDDSEVNQLGISFGTFGSSLVSVFEAALGEFDFDEFIQENNTCGLPPRARHSGMFLMATYLIIMAILLMNLLIAVLSTAHAEVYENAEKEFFFARTKLIQESARAVVNRRVPPPLNLVTVVFGFLIDTVGYMCHLLARCGNRISIVRKDGTVVERSSKPWTSSHLWRAIEGALQRIVFACTIGAVSWAAYTVLWIISVPYVGWKIFRERCPPLPYCANIGQGQKWSGYLISTVQILAVLFGWFGATAIAAVYCLVCILASVLLWFLGLAGIWGWFRTRRSEEGRRLSRWEKNQSGCPVKVIPGEEHGTRWTTAWQVANSKNCRMREERPGTHFHLGPFLKCTTGLDMKHLYLLICQRKEDENRSEKLDEIDKKREGRSRMRGQLPPRRNTSAQELEDEEKEHSESD